MVGNKTAETIVKQKPIPDKKFKKCWRNSIPPEKRQEILKLRKYYKMEHYKISKLLNCVKVWDKKMDWSKWFISSQYFINKNIQFQISMLRSDLYNNGEAYFVVKGT